MLPRVVRPPIHAASRELVVHLLFCPFDLFAELRRVVVILSELAEDLEQLKCKRRRKRRLTCSNCFLSSSASFGLKFPSYRHSRRKLPREKSLSGRWPQLGGGGEFPKPPAPPLPPLPYASKSARFFSSLSTSYASLTSRKRAADPVGRSGWYCNQFV